MLRRRSEALDAPRAAAQVQWGAFPYFAAVSATIVVAERISSR